MCVQAFTDNHHQISRAPITIIPQVHYNVNVDALNRKTKSGQCCVKKCVFLNMAGLAAARMSHGSE